MIRTPSSTLSDRSRLVRALTELSEAKLHSSEYNLAERLGHIIGLSGSLDLAQALRRLPNATAGSGHKDVQALRTDVLTSRERMMRIITGSFTPEAGDKQVSVPSTIAGIKPEALKTYEPYKRFYSTHQVEMSVGIQNLRTRIREGIAGVSVELHQLAELDRTLDESVVGYTRQLFNVIPKSLEQRFKQLLQQHEKTLSDGAGDELIQWLVPGGWLEVFYQDMRELLLAEFDLRLQPVLGLLEALNEHIDTKK